MLNLANNLKAIRNNKAMTQAEMANSLGISKASISCYEKGSRIPRDIIKIRYAKVAGKTVGELFFEE